MTEDQITELPCNRSDGQARQAAPADGACTARVVSLVEKRRKASSGGAKSGGAYHLQLRLDPATYGVFLQLKERAEAETMGELIRLALREYERALYEYDEIEHVDGAQAPSDVDTSAQRPNAKWVSQASAHSLEKDSKKRTMKSERLNVPLSNPAHARLKRLVQLTSAPSQAEAIRIALCVLDAKLDEYDEIVPKDDEDSVRGPHQPIEAAR